MSLKGRGAVVTGGGRGIGAAIARSLAEAGAAVLIVSRTRSEVEKTAAALRSSGYSAWAQVGDVTKPADVRKLQREAFRRLGRVDILVNNAGAGSSAPISKISAEEWQRMFDVNATGALLCTQAFLPAMVEEGWGRVVMVASVAGRMGAPYIAAYAASKHALLGLMRSAALEVAAKGVTVNAVCPGYVDTEMTKGSLDRITAKTGMSRKEALAYIEGTSPQKRLIESGEVAFLVRMLCDPMAKGINGQAIVLDGGGVQA